jgi:predicted ATP-dependent endonuclease of OLD family
MTRKIRINIEWILNKAQIDRVTDLIEIIDTHKSKMDKVFAPITMFLDSVNSFYKDTGKELTLDSVGQLGIKRPDGKTAPIEALSSGERQLLIIFAHLIFNEYGSRSNIFIIDEPELSLHLIWQEQFVEKAIKVSPSTQLILATHSPEIVGEYKDHCVSV